MKKKVLLLAYTNKNFGDDMFVKTICELNKDVDFYIEAPTGYKAVYSCIENLHVITKTLLYKVLNRVENLICKVLNLKEKPFRHVWLRKFDAVVYVVGALFDEDDLWEKALTRMGLEKYKRNQWSNSFYSDIPFFLLGCNMTRMRSKKYLDTMCYLFEGLTDICFRDRYSYEAFSQLSNTRYAPDIVFNYNCKNSTESSDLILISVWGALTQCDKYLQWAWAADKWDSYESFIVDIVHAFIAQGKTVCLLSLCTDEGDLEACHRVIKKGNFSDNIYIHSYDNNLDETIELFENAGFVIGTRFHSIVMAMNANKPFYPIAYESKTCQLLKDIGYEGHSSHIEDPTSYQTEKVLQQYSAGRIINVDEIKNQSAKQFEKLSAYLNDL